HAPTKLARTARHDRKLLSPRERRVRTVISAAAMSGKSKTIQVNGTSMGSARELRESTRIIRKRHVKNPFWSLFALSSQCVGIPASGSARNSLAIQVRGRSHADS